MRNTGNVHGRLRGRLDGGGLWSLESLVGEMGSVEPVGVCCTGSVKQVAEISMHVLSLEAIGPNQRCWAKTRVAAGLVLLAGSGEKPFLASSVPHTELRPLVCSPFLDLQNLCLPHSTVLSYFTLPCVPLTKETPPW